MAIHASRFSSHSRRVRQPRRHSPTLIGRVLKWLILLALVILITQGLRMALVLATPLPNIPNEPAYPVSSKVYDRTNLLLVSLDGQTPTYLAILSLSSGEDPKLLPIDPSILVNLPAGRGAYRLSGIPQLAKLDNLGGLNLLRDTLSKTLGIPIDGYVSADQANWVGISREFGSSPKDVLGDLSSPKFLWQVLTLEPWNVGLHGSISGGQLLSLAWEARDQSQVDTLNLSSVLLAGTTPLGEPAETIDPATFDETLGASFQELSIVRSRPKVNIVNSSGTVGAGATLARIVRNLGGDVISTDSGDQVSKSSILDHLGGSNLSGRVAPLIRADVHTDHQPSRADIDIVIGKDSGTIF